MILIETLIAFSSNLFKWTMSNLPFFTSSMPLIQGTLYDICPQMYTKFPINTNSIVVELVS